MLFAITSNVFVVVCIDLAITVFCCGAGQIVSLHMAADANLCDAEPLGIACCARAVVNCVHLRLAIIPHKQTIFGQVEVSKESCASSLQLLKVYRDNWQRSFN